LPGSWRERQVAARFAEALERGDIDAVVALLTHDVRLTMPPLPLEYRGRTAVTDFLTVICHGDSRRYRLVPTGANRQPAFGCYRAATHTPIWHAPGLLVLTPTAGDISAITRFVDNSLLAHFGLPRTLRG